MGNVEHYAFQKGAKKMSDKRFSIKISGSGDYDIWDNLKQEYFIADGSLPVNSFAREIVDMLNSLVEENEQLKNRLNDEYIKEHSID